MNKITTKNETEPIEIVINKANEAEQILYSCSSRLLVLKQLFDLKCEQEESLVGAGNVWGGNCPFFEGLSHFSEDLKRQIYKAIDLLFELQKIKDAIEEGTEATE